MSPMIGFTDKDLLRGTVVIPAWYRVRIDAVGEKLSKDGGSTNYPVEGIILKNADDGTETFAKVPLDWNFNSKAIGFAVGYLKALGIDVETNKRYDLSATTGMEVEIFVENDMYEGRIVNRVNHKYRPAR